MNKYYKITGMSEGEDIRPFYIVSTSEDYDNTLEIALRVSGDAVRYYEEITETEYTKGKQLYELEDMNYFLSQNWITLEQYQKAIENIIKS